MFPLVSISIGAPGLGRVGTGYLLGFRQHYIIIIDQRQQGLWEGQNIVDLHHNLTASNIGIERYPQFDFCLPCPSVWLYTY